ncbi:MAG: LLM class flavin-dependent oxidoreductase [Holophagales bacterium]|nr:LLM class flavin-dependent oxidoreductase [Holophagales bacterium]
MNGTPKPVRLSVLDVQWPGYLADLVPHLDELGYHRYWATEHHSPTQSASPTLLAALAAGLAERMRVGTAAVLLRFRSPLAVAEEFRLLELFFGGRIDLGMASAAPEEPVRSALLDGRPLPGREGFARNVEEVVRLVERRPAAEGQVNGSDVGPAVPGGGAGTAPTLWICGTSMGSARLAARLGTAYAFHDFLARSRPQTVDGPGALAAYRDEFQASERLAEPMCTAVFYGLCTSSESLSRELEESRISPTFSGNPERCREQLLVERERYGIDELVIQSAEAGDFSARLESYQLLAEVFGI